MIDSKGYPKNKVRTIVCAKCGKTDTRRMPPGRKYCSLECWRNGSRPSRHTGKELPCKNCGNINYFSKSRVESGSDLFCNRDCANLWQGRNKVEKTCIECRGVFKLSPSWEINRAGLYCSMKCRNLSPLHRQRLIAMNVEQQRKNPNKLELAGERILDELGVSYIPQVLIAGKFVVDALIPILGIVIQWDGDYWHGYGVSVGDIHPEVRIRKRMRLDKSQDAYLKECGYTVLRFWEHEVLDNQNSVRDRIKGSV